MRCGKTRVCFLVASLMGLLATTARAQTSESPGEATSPLDRLAQETLQNLVERIQRPFGRVIDRQRSRVFVAIEAETPQTGAVLFALRPIKEDHLEREEMIAQLQVIQVSPGILECVEIERSGRRHAEEGDIVRLDAEPVRLLLSPCIPLVDLPASIPQILAEKLRHGLRRRPEVQLLIDPELETGAAEAYRDGTLPGFLQQQGDLDEVLLPVLLLTPEKLVLNLETFSVSRRGAIDVSAVAVELDGVLRSWIQAGAGGPNGPPGFRLLSSHLFPWRLTTIGHSTQGVLAFSSDSLFVLMFESPGLRRTETLSLGPKAVPRRKPSLVVLEADILRLAAPDLAGGSISWIFSEERWPRALLPAAPPGHLDLEATGAGRKIQPALESIWKRAGGSDELAKSWWPAPDRAERPVILPLFDDLDGNARIDLLWNDRRGNLCVLRSERGQTDLYPGFGDVKAVQPRSEPSSRPVLWLTDDVCCGVGDRLHAAQLDGARLRLVWSSERFEGSIVGLASGDLDGDGAFDLVMAEQVGPGTRLHVFMAIPGERTPARGLAVSQAASK